MRDKKCAALMKILYVRRRNGRIKIGGGVDELPRRLHLCAILHPRNWGLAGFEAWRPLVEGCASRGLPRGLFLQVAACKTDLDL